MEIIREIIRFRDKLSEQEIDAMFEEANGAIAEGEDPEEVISYVFGLEPDYIWDSEIDF
jgi:hypothetical protein